MSLGGEDLRKTEELPGAFPSEDAIAQSELNDTSTTAGSGTAPAGTQQHTKPYPEHELGAHQNVARANNSGVPSQSQNIAHTAAGSQSTASPADSDPDHLLRRAGAEGAGGGVGAAGRGQQQQPKTSLASAANPLSGPAVVGDEDSFGADNAPDIMGDLKAVGSGDAAVAVKDAAAPVVSAASEQAMQAAGYAAENAGPAASAASEQAKSAAIYTKDSAVPAANAAAKTAQANVREPKLSHSPSENQTSQTETSKQAPAALGGGTTAAANTASPRDVAPGVPGQVRSSIAEAGEAPEAAASRRAVHDKGRVEGELLGYAAELDAEDEARRRAQQQRPAHPPVGGALPRLDSGPQTPSTGVAVVLGTDTERSFPLGSHPVNAGGATAAGEEGQQAAAHHAGPAATDGVRTGGVPQVSSGGSATGSAAPRRPPVEDKVPVRATEEQAVGNGPGTYKKLSSGTPSGVGE